MYDARQPEEWRGQDTEAFFDPTLPRSASQVVALWDFTRCLSAEAVADTRVDGCAVNLQLVATLEREAVKAWLDR